MDRDADRHGEEERGRNKKRKASGLLSDKKVHATWRRGERNGAGILTHFYLLYLFLTSSPPDVLLQLLGYTGTSGEAVN